MLINMLLDHFHPPLSERRHPHSFLLSWVVSIAVWLNEQLPKGWFAEPIVILHNDVNQKFAVHVHFENGEIVAIVSLVTPVTKGHKIPRDLFISACATQVKKGTGLVLIDIVTTRDVDMHRNLHQVLNPSAKRQIKTPRFAAAYHQSGRRREMEFDIQLEPLSIGGALPTMPLYLKNGPLVPVDLAETYQKALKAVRIDFNEV